MTRSCCRRKEQPPALRNRLIACGRLSPIRGAGYRGPLGAHVSWDIIVSVTASSDVSPATRGTIAVTGRPSASTRRIRSRRNHFETRFGSVEMMISSKCPSRTAFCTDSNGSDPPTSPSTGRRAARSSNGSALSSVQSAAFRSLTSGTSSANREGPARPRCSTASRRRGVAAVLLATIRTRAVLGDSIGCLSPITTGGRRSHALRSSTGSQPHTRP